MPNLREPSTIRWSDEDKAIMARLRARLGLLHNSDVIRYAIRYLDEHGPIQGRGEERDATANTDRNHVA